MDKDKDIFSEIIKDKLNNYTLPVDDDSWDKIEERLNSVKREKAKHLWIAVIAVAASIALLLLLLQINTTTYHHETADKLSSHEKEIIQDVSEKEIVKSDLQQNVEHPTVFRKSQSGKQLAENELTVEVISEKAIPEENQVAPTREEPSVTENPSTSSIHDFDFGEEAKIPVIKHKKRQSISLSFGSGGNLLANNTTAPQIIYNTSEIETMSSNFAYYKAASQDIIQTQAEDILSREDYPNVIHHLPISFGITIKKDLSRTIAIESGIVYSYLATTFSRDFYVRSKADLQLHYIGVPLNIHTRLYENHNSQWGIYLSAGGMVEKGILSHFVQKNFYDDIDNTVMTVNLNNKIKGLQWSVGISQGVDYQIYKNYSIYLEPKISYYFDNDQPESARTQHPVVVGINAGLRYTW